LLCTILQDQPPYSDSFVSYDFPEIGSDIFLTISMVLFPVQLAGLQILPSVLPLLFDVEQIALL